MNTQRKRAAESFAKQLEQYLAQLPEHQLYSLKGDGTASLESWFLGPKAENQELFRSLAIQAINEHCNDRRIYFKQDPEYITEAVKETEEYKESVFEMKQQFEKLLNQLKLSVPFYGYRYHGHMNWDLTMPGLLGYFAGMLYNQNNVAAEASPVTTILEMLVGDDLCEMLGYYIPDKTEIIEKKKIRPWGHITCDGTVANIEGMWAARNLKFYAISVAEALKNESSLYNAKQMTVKLVNGRDEVLIELDTWSLLNLKIDELLSLPERIKSHLKDDGVINNNDEEDQKIEKIINDCIEKYTIQFLGYNNFSKRYLKDISHDPAIMITATMHYSFPKGAAILGIGASNIISIPVDYDARMNVNILRQELEECLLKKRPVMMTVCVIGSTEESAVDPLTEVINLREEYRSKGLEFWIHADAAWGGYFATTLNLRNDDSKMIETPSLSMSEYVKKQYRSLKDADSITIDPHKAGYIPYPAGGLCYRNSSMRNLVSFTAPVVYHGGIDPTVGVYGIEGSKPGAAAAGVYLSHQVIRTTPRGYGKILGKTIFNSKRLYAAIATMANDNDPYTVIPFHRLPSEKANKPESEIREELQFIRENIVNKSNEEIIKDPKVMELLCELGSDQSIIPYIFNFKFEQNLNKDLNLMNELNQTIFKMLSLSPDRTDVLKTPLLLTSSEFNSSGYGEDFVNWVKERCGVEGEGSVTFLLSTTMNPFLTDTPKGSMIPTLIQSLRETVIKAIDQIKN